MKNSLAKLSYEILKITNSEMPRSIFLNEVTNLLIEWFKCSELKLLFRIPKNDTLFELIHCTREAFGYSIIKLEELPQHLEVEESASLWESILHDNFDSSSTFFTEKGSFWTINFGNLSASYRNALGSAVIDDSTVDRDYSLLICPFIYNNERVGLVQLKNINPEVFASLGAHIFEEFAQTLSVILTNQYTQSLLSERVKELAFLYKMANITQQESLSLENIILQIVALIPPAFQYPEITAARVTLNGKEYTNKPIEEYAHKLVSDIKVDRKKCGVIEVFYTEKCPKIDEGPFFNEERSLLDNIAAELATIISRKKSDRIN